MMVLSRKYYRRRLWKITIVLMHLGEHGINGRRFVKHYERRAAVGEPWEYVRGATFDLPRGEF